jgi:hypothetical protein
MDVQGCTGKMRDFLEQNMVFLLAAGVGILVLGMVTTYNSPYLPSKAPGKKIYRQMPLVRRQTIISTGVVDPDLMDP